MSDSPSLLTRLIRPLWVNDVSTEGSEWYPELKPRRYREEVDTVFDCARQVLSERDGWSVRSAHPNEARIEAEATTKVVGFVDDVTIRINEGEDPTVGAVVHVHSRSRLGQGDMGQNAKTIREFFDRLDACVARGKKAGSQSESD